MSIHFRGVSINNLERGRQMTVGESNRKQVIESDHNESNGKVARKKKVLKELTGMLIYIGVVLVLTFLVIHYVGQRTQVSGDSMFSTLHDEDHLIVDKISYRFKAPERYDIIVFPYQHKQKTYYIKRLIGLPGETVQVKDGFVYIDGELLNENYGREIMIKSGRAEEEIQLGEDEYFVLGDNRNASADSRETDVGNIKRKDIIGRAFIRIWPLNRFGILKHQ